MPRVAALLVAALAAITVLGGAAPAAGHAAPRQRAAAPITIALTGQSFALVPGQPWRANYALSGDLPAAPATTAPVTDPALAAPPAPATTARIVVHRPVVEPLALDAAFSGLSTGIVTEAVVPVTLSSNGDQTRFALEVPTRGAGGGTEPAGGVLVLDGAGLHPVDVELLVDGAVVATSRTFADQPPATPPADLATTSVAVVADVTDPGPDPSAVALAAARTELQALTETAGALGGLMTVRIPGPVAADIAANAPALRTRLRTAFADAELLGVPSPALDPSSAVTSGLQDVFAAHLRAGEDLVTGSLALAPPVRAAWLVDEPVSTPAAALLREPLGYGALVFDRPTYGRLEGSIGGVHDPSLAFTVELADGRTLPGLVLSPASTWLDRTELDRRSLTATDGAVRAMSTLRIYQQLDPTLRRAAVLGLPTGIAPDPEVAATLVDYLAATPGFALSGLAALPPSTDVQTIPDVGPEVVRLPPTAGVDLSPRVAAVDTARGDVDAAASMLPGGTQGAAWNAALDAVLSTAVTAEEAVAELVRIDAEVEELYSSVVLPRPFTVTLTGRDSTLPLRILNERAEEVTVIVQPSSPKLRFPEGDAAVVLAPATYTEVTIPVQAQTNGTSAVGVVLVTPTGGQVIEGPMVLTARVNALSGLGQVVTGAAVLVLVSWWYGHFRRRRRARRALLGEVDNPVIVALGELSPDAAETVAGNGEHAERAGGVGRDAKREPEVEVETSDPP